MHVSFSSLGMYNVVEADINPDEINGVGGYSSPQIWLPIRIHVSHRAIKSHEGFEFISLAGQIHLEGRPFARSSPVPVGFTIQPRFSELKSQYHCLEFPVDHSRVAALEKVRAGGDLKLRLDAALEVVQLHALNQSSPGQVVDTVWGQVQRHRLHLNADLVIPRAAWIERVLPNIGFGVVHLVELPAVSIEGNSYLTHAFEALRQAQELHRSGHYPESVGKCRVALEEFFEYPAVTDGAGITRNVPILKSSWETRLGKATYDWLNQSLAALKAGTNKPHHLASATYNQFDSLMIQMVTTAVVSYAAKHLEADVVPSK
jgi:hypothetical protein